MGPPQLPILPFELGDTAGLFAGGAGSPAAVDLGLLDPLAERFGDDVQLSGDAGDQALALEREMTDEGVVERFRVFLPERAQDHARIWEIVPEDDVQDAD